MKKENISCEVIQDLLPLYEDQYCSEASRALVEEHLKECEICRKKSKSFQAEIPLPPDGMKDPDVQGIKKGIRKMKRIRVCGIAALSICLSIIFAVIPIVNYKVGSGITYANLDEIHVARQFAEAIKERDYEKAYSYLGIWEHYEELIHEEYPKDHTPSVIEGVRIIRENGFAWYDEVCKEKFLQNMQKLESSESLIVTYDLRNVERQVDGWSVTMEIGLQKGTSYLLRLRVGNDKIREAALYFTENIEQGRLDKMLEEMDRNVGRYYMMPTLNETICELLYEGSDYDWRVLFKD